MTTSLRAALDRVVEFFRNDEATLFIASEFLISSDIQANLDRNTKFGRAMVEAEASVNKNGFQWWQPPEALKQIIELTRSEIRKADDGESARAVIAALVSDENPGFIQRVRVD